MALLVELLRDPGCAAGLTPAQWDVVVPQARQAHLLATLAARLWEAGVSGAVPPEVARHLGSAVVLQRKQCQGLTYELRHLVPALAEAGEPLLLLKGAAYIVAALPPAAGRLMSDIDILVHAGSLPAVEAALAAHGWSAGKIDPYNERYYRQWMHEIPPLGHRDRRSTLDVHHSILPPTSTGRIDVDALWAQAVAIQPGVCVLGPEDMVLHSAAHLFHEGEFGHGLRDLLDLDGLLRHFAEQGGEGFYARLTDRARHMGLQRPLYYACVHATRVLGTPLPPALVRGLRPRGLAALKAPFMDFLFRRAFTPDHSSCRLPLTGFALFCLYVRSHYLRMPLHLLLPHLLRKAWMDLRPEAASTPGRKAAGQGG
ncbi:nucleotidyltransferase domain-containing protein [Parahaliea mediterranea]|uniref:nucleotidyltransferase domain-containing protein n=1 Tax=Parahaliea mediterranea TaxID=651086 RepID=UPI000E2FADBE|nr:nucleotidyltransferase family protein [Parahaliea mediterranea]